MPSPQTKWEETVTRAMRTCVRVFGEGLDADGVAQVTYSHAGGPTYTLDGIFEATTEAVDLDTGVTITSHAPRVSFALADMQATPNAGDTCVIRGKTYRVVDPMFDGQGTVTLRLHEA